jgi:micrococcal nuclease
MCLFGMLMFISTFVTAEVIEGKVMAVWDGNTLEVKADDNETYKLSLAGIDSPELEQPFGEEARTVLEKLVLKKNVKIELSGKDRWGNQLAIVWLKGQVDVRLELLKQGLAWTAERNPLPQLEVIRTEAKQNALGLWAQPEPTPPWIFRRQQTLTQAKGS